ncbi:hypothetical protein CTAYLR_006771, partial [Chrysophaeum taylorii]
SRAVSQGEGRTKTLVVAYERWELRWIVLCDAQGGVMDVMPVEGGLPDGEPEIYAAYPLAQAFPSLRSPPCPAHVVADEARSAFHARQVAALPRSLRSAFVEAAIASKTSSRIEIVAEFMTEDDAEQLGDAPPPVVELSFERHGDDVACVEARVVRLPRQRLPATCAAFRLPAFSTLDAYLAQCHDDFAGPWCRRRNLAAELRRLYAVVDLDNLDFSRIQLVVHVRADAAKRLCVIDLTFGQDFPAKPPTMTVRDFRGAMSSGEPRELDRLLYLYSPRWDTNRVATELIDHACKQILAPGF